MPAIGKLAFSAALALAMLAAADTSASAQGNLTNGPNGTQPNTLSSDSPAGVNGKQPSRAMLKPNARRSTRRSHRAGLMSRPLVVRRAPEVAAVEPAPVVNTGPGTLVTGPLGFGSNIVSLPFRGLNGIFPATGDFASNPLVIIGAPIHAIGDIAQVPFRIIGAPFGGTTITTY